jgi:hypothetical protein
MLKIQAQGLINTHTDIWMQLPCTSWPELLHDLLLEGLFYVIQLDEVCHHDDNIHTCLYPGALVVGIRALMSPCKEKPSLKFRSMNFTHRNYRTTYNASFLSRIFIVFISCNKICFLLLKQTIYTHEVYVTAIRNNKYTAFPLTCFSSRQYLQGATPKKYMI